jgi:hypothetical protein
LIAKLIATGFRIGAHRTNRNADGGAVMMAKGADDVTPTIE